MLGSLVHGIRDEPDPFEPELAEAEVEDDVHRLRPEAAAAEIVLADRDPETRRAVDPVDLEEVDPADRLVVGDQADDEREPVAPGLTGRSLSVGPAAGEAARHLAHEPRRVGVLVPAVDMLGIIWFERAEVDVLTAQDRIGGARRRLGATGRGAS